MLKRGTYRQCFVCRMKRSPEHLGRMLLPLRSNGHLARELRVCCVTCAQAVFDSWPQGVKAPPPIYHGF